MKLSDFKYTLPKNLIANSPTRPRDHSKLMVVDRRTGTIRHKRFYELFDIVRAGDVLVMNNTKVMPSRVFGKKKTGGTVEVLFLREIRKNVWEVLGKNLPKPGEKIIFNNFYAKVIKKGLHTAIVRVFTMNRNMGNLLTLEGKTPIPPYISTKISETQLRAKYQTVYAEKTGSVAAPTAGLHFTKRLLTKLKKKGVVMQYVTLHVGPGTFLPIKETDITKHKMHSEYYSVDKSTVKKLNQAKTGGKRIIAVGTTTARVLETLAGENCKLKIGSEAGSSNLNGETAIYIYPPYKFQFVDALNH